MIRLHKIDDANFLNNDYIEIFKRTRKVPHNLFYTYSGAQSFYTYRGQDIIEIDWHDESRFFAEQAFWQPGKSIAFISLGCGNAGPERMLLSQAHQTGVGVQYYGVDTSEAMLDLAQQTLEDESFDHEFVLSDFTTDSFIAYIRQATENVDTRIFAMMGGTFGNFDQAVISRVLGHVVAEGDYFYLDVVPQYVDAERNKALKLRLSQLPTNLKLFFDELMAKLCIEDHLGYVYGEETEDAAAGAIGYRFLFKANEDMDFPCLGDSLHLKTGETVELLNIRAYQQDALISYLSDAGFDFVGTYIPDVGNLSHLWQRFLFRRRVA